MSLFKIDRSIGFKTITVFGLKFKVLRKRAKKSSRMYKLLHSDTILDTNGFSLVGNLDEISGEANVLKYFDEALKGSDIRYDKADLFGYDLPKFKNKIAFTTSYYYKHSAYNNISVLVWEFESGMLEVRPYAFEDVKAVITLSDFCANYFKPLAPKDVQIFKVNCPLTIDRTKLSNPVEIRKNYHISPNDFVCFFNFSYASSYNRKNPEAVLRAFADAFTDKGDVKLILKTTAANDFSTEREKLNTAITKLNLNNKVVVINDVLLPNDIYSLISASDVYISLHRGEGLGLGMLEAMLLAKPVIATSYGGNTDFMDKSNSLPVDYKMVDVSAEQIDLKPYKAMTSWAEPDEQMAADYLMKLYNDRNFAKELGIKARKSAEIYTSKDGFIKQMKNILNTINKGENK